MLDNYKNILANKFMRDTNYIIIKDTDDLEELERQWELFETQLTKRQQRLSDDRSIEIWNKTNQEHYEALKLKLIKDIDSKYNDDNLDDNTILYDPDEDFANIADQIAVKNYESIKKYIKANSMQEDTKIPIKDNHQEDDKYWILDVHNIDKDNLADQFEIDTNINIISKIHGINYEEKLKDLEQQFIKFNSQSTEHKIQSDDESLTIYNMTNTDRYNFIKGKLLKHMKLKKVTTVKPTENESLKTNSVQQLGEFVSQVYQNMQSVNESESFKSKQHKRLHDCPYFTPTELIDMGVHGNHNFYSKDADNDGLINGTRIPLWFDSYKDMCMDHIFEDYSNEWIDTLDLLYSDFEDIKSSNNEEKILSRKQSILDLGWNPEIPFNRKNRLKASKRVSDILNQTIPKDIFINLNDIPECEEEMITEETNKNTHKPVLLIFTQGKTPIISQGIKLFTGSNYSHASISFDPELKEVYSYNMRGENFGFVKENLSSFKDNIISVMAFFAPINIVNKLKDKIKDFENNKTTFDLRIFFNKILHIDHKVSKDEYHQVCSTFVDTVLKSGNINLVGNINIPDPGQLYNATKNVPNKIIEVFSDIATKYDGKKVKKKISTLLKNNIKSIEESIKDLDSSEYNDIYHNIDLWESDKSNLLWITGLSGSGKSTISKEIANIKNVIHIELDDLQIAKMNNWDTTKNEVLDSYIYSVGGLDGIFTYCNFKKDLKWKDIVSNKDCYKEFNKFFNYVIKYAKSNKTKKFVIEGVQIAMCSTNSMIEKISKYPIILKMNGPFKTEFRREKRLIKYGIDKRDNFKDIFMNVVNCNRQWIKNNFYINDYKELKYFKSHINEASFINDKNQTVPKKCPECGSDVGVFLQGEPIYRCTNKKCKKYFGVVKPPKCKSIKEQTSILNEVKQFPVEFDEDGNLIIYKARTGSISYGDEIDDSVQLLESYRNSSNIEGVKYEISKLWYINDCIEKKLKKRLKNEQYKKLIDTRSVCLNAFKFNLDFLMKYEKGFNFSDYYNSTPFSDNSIKITSNTLKYALKTISNII